MRAEEYIEAGVPVTKTVQTLGRKVISDTAERLLSAKWEKWTDKVSLFGQIRTSWKCPLIVLEEKRLRSLSTLIFAFVGNLTNSFCRTSHAN